MVLIAMVENKAKQQFSWAHYSLGAAGNADVSMRAESY